MADWESLGGELSSGPDVCSWAPERLDVFARGTDNTLWHKWFDGGWSDWESLGGVLTSDPTAVSWSNGRIDVFARGTDNTLLHKWFDGGWSDWESLGGVLTSGPDVCSWASGRLDVFVRGTNNALWHKWFDGGWSDWESLGGVLTSDPTAVSWSNGRIDVFARGTDNALWHTWFDGSWSHIIAGTTSHVRIEVHRVHCGNTEDVTGADELYIVGALSDGTTSRGALTSPMSINDNQEKEFNPSQRVIFDADVEPNAVVRGGLKAFDEDFSKDWAKYGDTVNKISNQVSQGLKSTQDPTAVAAGEILSYATKAFGFFASLDKDDELGTIELNVPAQGTSVEEIGWKFQKKGSVFNPGVSTWNYTVVIRVTRS
ncbi:hypothetical protein NDI49_27030 [Trichocoleus sp. ST-U3]